MTLTLCVLLYGNYPDLAKRCLLSLANPDFFGADVRDVRIGLNDVSETTRQFATDWAWAASRALSIPVTLLTPENNTLKYPTMRRMFQHSPLAKYVVWFDDDSYLDDCSVFWKSLQSTLATEPDMLGQRWYRRMAKNQWFWITEQPWASSSLEKPTNFEFCTGGFWVIRSRLLQQLDWPIPELRHCGGDCMLGEALRHLGAKTKVFDSGVRINADDSGKHSGAPRRGHTEAPLAWHYSGRVLPTDHQKFTTRWITYTDGEQTCGSI